MLESYGDNVARGGVLQVMTDGEENRYPYIKDVRDDVIKKKVIVDSILYTSQADHALKELSKETGGISHFVSGNSNANSLYNALSDTIRSRVNDVRVLPIRVSRIICISVIICLSLYVMYYMLCVVTMNSSFISFLSFVSYI